MDYPIGPGLRPVAYERLSPSERKKIEQFLRTVARGLQACGVRGNWGSWHLSAVGVIGYAIRDEELIRWATTEFKRQIRDELGDDGLWPESVHTYHYFPLGAFMHFARRVAGYVDLYHWEAKPGKSLALMFSAPLAYAYPDFRLPAINDGWFQAYVAVDYYEFAACRSPNPGFDYDLAAGYHAPGSAGGMVPTETARPRQGLYAFLFGKELRAERHDAPMVFSSTDFPVLRIAVLRSAIGP